MGRADQLFRVSGRLAFFKSGLARWDKGGKLYVTSYRVTSRQQMGLAARQEIKQPEDLLGKTVGFLRASGGHHYFGRYVKKYNLTRSSVFTTPPSAPGPSAGSSAPFKEPTRVLHRELVDVVV